MTAVVIAPRREDPTNDTEVVVSGGWFQIRPSKAYAAGGQWVQPVWSNPVQLSGTAVTVQLDPLVDVPYELYMELPTGRVGPKLVVNEFRFVTGSGPVGWETLTQVTGPSGDAVLSSADVARITALEAAVASISGGASSLAAVSGISTDAKTMIATPNNFATMRGLLGAAPTASPTFTTALTAANPTFTGTVTIPDNALAIADTSGLQTALDAKAPLASPTLTGTPSAPTATAGTNTTQLATTAFVLANAGSGSGAPLNSPAFTGVPTAPTATAGTNTTQLATTAFVTAAANALGNTVYIEGAGSARVHPVTGAALPAYPQCGVIWVTHNEISRPAAALSTDLWFNENT